MDLVRQPEQMVVKKRSESMVNKRKNVSRPKKLEKRSSTSSLQTHVLAISPSTSPPSPSGKKVPVVRKSPGKERGTPGVRARSPMKRGPHRAVAKSPSGFGSRSLDGYHHDSSFTSLNEDYLRNGSSIKQQVLDPFLQAQVKNQEACMDLQRKLMATASTKGMTRDFEDDVESMRQSLLATATLNFSEACLRRETVIRQLSNCSSSDIRHSVLDMGSESFFAQDGNLLNEFDEDDYDAAIPYDSDSTEDESEDDMVHIAGASPATPSGISPLSASGSASTSPCVPPALKVAQVKKGVHAISKDSPDYVTVSEPREDSAGVIVQIGGGQAGNEDKKVVRGEGSNEVMKVGGKRQASGKSSKKVGKSSLHTSVLRFFKPMKLQLEAKDTDWCEEVLKNPMDTDLVVSHLLSIFSNPKHHLGKLLLTYIDRAYDLDLQSGKGDGQSKGIFRQQQRKGYMGPSRRMCDPEYFENIVKEVKTLFVDLERAVYVTYRDMLGALDELQATQRGPEFNESYVTRFRMITYYAVEVLLLWGPASDHSHTAFHSNAVSRHPPAPHSPRSGTSSSGMDSPLSPRSATGANREPFYSKFLRPAYHIMYEKTSEECSRCIVQVLTCNPSHMGIRKRFWLLVGPDEMLENMDPKAPYHDAVERLSQLPQRRGTKAKLACLTETMDIIDQCVKTYYAKKDIPTSKLIVNADDLLPIMSYIIVKSNIPDIFLECAFLLDFCPEYAMMGREGYALITLQGCMQYIESASVSSLVRNSLFECLRSSSVMGSSVVDMIEAAEQARSKAREERRSEAKKDEDSITSEDGNEADITSSRSSRRRSCDDDLSSKAKKDGMNNSNNRSMVNLSNNNHHFVTVQKINKTGDRNSFNDYRENSSSKKPSRPASARGSAIRGRGGLSLSRNTAFQFQSASNVMDDRAMRAHVREKLVDSYGFAGPSDLPNSRVARRSGRHSPLRQASQEQETGEEEPTSPKSSLQEAKSHVSPVSFKSGTPKRSGSASMMNVGSDGRGLSTAVVGDGDRVEDNNVEGREGRLEDVHFATGKLSLTLKQAGEFCERVSGGVSKKFDDDLIDSLSGTDSGKMLDRTDVSGFFKSEQEDITLTAFSLQRAEVPVANSSQVESVSMYDSECAQEHFPVMSFQDDNKADQPPIENSKESLESNSRSNSLSPSSTTVVMLGQQRTQNSQVSLTPTGGAPGVRDQNSHPTASAFTDSAFVSKCTEAEQQQLKSAHKPSVTHLVDLASPSKDLLVHTTSLEDVNLASAVSHITGQRVNDPSLRFVEDGTNTHKSLKKRPSARFSGHRVALRRQSSSSSANASRTPILRKGENIESVERPPSFAPSMYFRKTLLMSQVNDWEASQANAMPIE